MNRLLPFLSGICIHWVFVIYMLDCYPSIDIALRVFIYTQTVYFLNLFLNFFMGFFRGTYNVFIQLRSVFSYI